MTAGADWVDSARRLLDALRPPAGTPAATPEPGAAHGADCRWCPVCQAAAVLRLMVVGDRAFFYHSNIGKEVVGIVEVVREAYPDPTDETGRWVCVDVRAVEPLRRPVTLASIKGEPRLEGIALLRQSRLSCMAVSDAHWRVIREMGGLS